jgi:hypothetical protein
MHGENLIGRCFCVPGYTGKTCETVTTKPTCTNKDDRCFYSEEAGVFLISFSRWKKVGACMGVWVWVGVGVWVWVWVWVCA